VIRALDVVLVMFIVVVVLVGDVVDHGLLNRCAIIKESMD